MRLRPGRPDITRHRGRFAVPAAGPRTAPTVTWLGVATLLISDGTSAIMTDGFFSRPPLRRVAAGRLSSSQPRVDGCLARAGVRRLDAVVCVHTHYDHGMDSALVADRTGATLLGGASTANIGYGYGLAPEAIMVVASGDTVRLGAYDITLVESQHCPPDRYPGLISEPVRPPARASVYRCGEAWSVLVAHRPTGHRCLIQGSAGHQRGALDGLDAGVVYLGLGQLGRLPREYLTDYWNETVRAVGARTVIGIHWDDFFRPLSQPLRALPFAVDDLDFSMRVLGELADRDGVALRLPTVWRTEDPWA